MAGESAKNVRIRIAIGGYITVERPDDGKTDAELVAAYTKLINERPDVLVDLGFFDTMQILVERK